MNAYQKRPCDGTHIVDIGMWRENPHDDLVLAVALAAWYRERYKPVVDNTPPSISYGGVRY
jgi:hypothetical protein